MSWIGCVRCENIRRNFVARTFALIAPVQPILHWVSCSNEMVPDAPKHYETYQNMSLGSNGADKVCSLRKLQCDFVVRTYVLIVPVQYVLQQVSCSYETIPYVPKCYKTDWNISLESNGMGWVRLLRKIPTWLRGTKFCINCSSSPRFAPSFMQLRNNPKCTKILQRSNGVDWVCLLRKIPTWLHGTNFCINCTTSDHFAPRLLP